MRCQFLASGRDDPEVLITGVIVVFVVAEHMAGYENCRVHSALIFISIFHLFERQKLRFLHHHGLIEYLQTHCRRKVGWRSGCNLVNAMALTWSTTQTTLLLPSPVLGVKLHCKPSRAQCAANGIKSLIHPTDPLARGSNDQNRHGDGLLDATNASSEQQNFRMPNFATLIGEG